MVRSGGESASPLTIGAAAADAKRQLLEAASAVLEVEPERLSVRDGRIHVAGNALPVPVEEITGKIAPHMIQGHGSRGPNPQDRSARTFGAQCVEVEVDVETGEITLLRVAAAHDCGRIINPTLVDSQVLGAVTQGIGFALSEERVVDARTGIVLNANLEEYKVPTAADAPPVHHAQVNLPDPEANPTGAKGIGEP